MSKAIRNFVSFAVGPVEYAVHISRVCEVLKPLLVEPSPRPPLGVVGVVELRNEVVPVLDLRVRFGLGSALHTKLTKWILVDTGDSRIVLVVDCVYGVFRADIANERAAPPFLGEDDLHTVLFVTRREQALVFALDVEPFSRVRDGMLSELKQ
jgi:purine-binding chemotaxis protein CheW